MKKGFKIKVKTSRKHKITDPQEMELFLKNRRKSFVERDRSKDGFRKDKHKKRLV